VLIALSRRCPRSYDGTAIGFLLTTHFGGFVPVRSAPVAPYPTGCAARVAAG